MFSLRQAAMNTMMIAFANLLFQLGQARLDFLSALVGGVVGAVVAIIVVFLLYRNRERLSALRGSVQERATTYQVRAARGHEARYRDAVNWKKVDGLLDFGGIRIEDNVLVTEGTPEVLTTAIPKTA